MIGYLKGKLKWQSDNQIIIDINGVGYLVEVTEVFHSSRMGEKVSVYVYTYVREDALKLYGFETMEERKLFETLLSVSRIGPKAGLNILSTLSYNRFINAIMTENISVLKEVSGIGPKTAQRLILELKNKIDDLARDIQMSSPEGLEVARNDELYEALSNLGYSNREVDRALQDIDFEDDIQLEDKIKKVLSYLGKESF